MTEEYKLGEMYYHDQLSRRRYGILLKADESLAWAYWDDSVEGAKRRLEGREDRIGRAFGNNIHSRYIHRLRKTLKELVE